MTLPPKHLGNLSTEAVGFSNRVGGTETWNASIPRGHPSCCVQLLILPHPQSLQGSCLPHSMHAGNFHSTGAESEAPYLS